jgi:hypothetical protein
MNSAWAWLAFLTFPHISQSKTTQLEGIMSAFLSQRQPNIELGLVW